VAVLVVAAGARRGRRLYDLARRLLELRGIGLAESHLAEGTGEAVERVREAVEAGAGLVIVGGGDGTIRAVLPILADRACTLAVLPLGTSNNFARSIGIPMDLVGAIDVIADGTEAAIDIGLIKGEYFANNLSIGYPRAVISATPREVKRWLGALGYALYESRFILRQRLFCCTVATSSGSERFLTRHLLVVNGASYGTRPIAPDVRIDDGLLDLFALASLSRWQSLRFWVRLLLGVHLHDPEMRRIRTGSARITTDPVRPVIVDGERGPMTPVEIGIAPKALRVMAPVPDTVVVSQSLSGRR
jgi:YegS/Rv2252/BmrU family lipid kinase